MAILDIAKRSCINCFLTVCLSLPSYVYKCVCQQHSELLYNDLTTKIANHLQQVSTSLEVSKCKSTKSVLRSCKSSIFFPFFFQASPPEYLIENFNVAFTQYTASLQCIVPVFMYLVCIFLYISYQ